MQQELQDRLFEKYPRIFSQKDLSPQETCMCFGIACGDGWYDIIDTLCHCIQKYTEFKDIFLSASPNESILYLRLFSSANFLENQL